MDWGAPFKAAWNGATSAGKAAANAVSSSAKYAYDAVKRGAVAAKDAAVAGATMAKDAAVAGASAAKDAVGDFGDTVREGTISARERQIRNAYATGRAHLSEHPAGCPSQSCPYKKAECDRLKGAKNKAIMAEHAYIGQGKDEDADRSAQLEKMLKDNHIQALNPVTDREELAKLFADEDFAKMLEPDKSSFRARVYKMPREGEQPPYEYVVSFRGTVPSEVQDLWADGAQAVGIPTGHYNKAMEVAEALRSSNTMLADSGGHPPKVSFAGHSLGGGLASVAAVVSGYPASTYNAAGLNMRTVTGVPIEKAGPVDAYFNAADPLNAIQDNRKAVVAGILAASGSVPLGAWAAGNELAGTPVLPQAYGDRRPLPLPGYGRPPGLLEGHGVPLLIDGIEMQQKELGCQGAV